MHGKIDGDVYKNPGEPFHIENPKLGISAEGNTLGQAVKLYANALKRAKVEALEDAVQWK